MGELCRIKEEHIKYAIDKINYWYKKNIKLLSIITVPFNTPCIFADIIDYIAGTSGRILYVWGKDNENKELITLLKKKNSKINYSYIKEGDSNTELAFTNYKNIEKVEGHYELIIFDDITYFSCLSAAKLREIAEVCVKKAERVILYSIEKTSLIGEKFELADYNYDEPFVEPRVITTRVNLDKDMPYSAYDYIKWFAESRKKTVICVPDDERVEIVYDYFTEKLKFKGAKIIKALKSDEIKKCEKVSIIKDKAIFIITNKAEELLEYCQVNNAVILPADNIKFNYKKMLYICGQLRNINNRLPEVLFVCNDESSDIEKARKMARNFNKKVWDKKLKEL